MACLLLTLPAPAQGGQSPPSIRIATFNCSLNRNTSGELLVDLQSGTNLQARKVAKILRSVRPDIVLLNEFDYDDAGASIASFRTNYLEAVGDWVTEPPLKMDYAWSGPVNTGVPSGRDLDHDGKTDGLGDAFGFGRFPGQYGMVVLSRFPIAADSVRTFQKLLWKDMPDSSVPSAATVDGIAWYSDEDLKSLRLSSKSHGDVPIHIGDKTLHVLVSHPTPPAFDGPEDRNGRRNHDEIRLWADYISHESSGWIVDDTGVSGGLAVDASFVILGDQNADPSDGDSFDHAIDQLLLHERIDSKITPTSQGGVEATKLQGKANTQHKGDPAQDTSDFSDGSVGNLRVDYVLPSRDIKALSAGIFWPPAGASGADLIDCSDHRLVWLDIAFP
ncbi:MAG TPA: endonuclease/exonuclease/phosphatase family protein [Planctomycetaceae bacterium]|nr:endonuclease/exonuclease/phosphatase family protein [Planctomycetaceae bacterium]